MSIPKLREMCKNAVGRAPHDVLIIGILVLACLVSFGLGYFAGLDAQPFVTTSVATN